jgi:hypothetical protein
LKYVFLINSRDHSMQMITLYLIGFLMIGVLDDAANGMTTRASGTEIPGCISASNSGDRSFADSAEQRGGWISAEVSGGLMSRSQEGPGTVDRGEYGIELGGMYLVSRYFAIGGSLATRRSGNKNPMTGFMEDETIHFFANLLAFPVRDNPLYLRGSIGSASVFYTDDPTDRTNGWATRFGVGYEFRLDDRLSIQTSLNSTWTWIDKFPGSPPMFSKRRDQYISINAAILRNLPELIPVVPAGTPALARPRAFAAMIGYSQLGSDWDPVRGYLQFGVGGWIRVRDWPIQIESMFLFSIHLSESDTFPATANPPAEAVVKTGPVRNPSAIGMIAGSAGSNTPRVSIIELQAGIRREWQIGDGPFSFAIGAGFSGINIGSHPKNIHSDDASAVGLYGRWMILHNSTMIGQSVMMGLMAQGETSTAVILHGNRYHIRSFGCSFIMGVRL